MTLENFTPAKCREMGWGDKSTDFSLFMGAVNFRVEELCGMSLEDLTDFPFADYFEDGANPEDVADDLLADQGFDFGH